MSNLQCRDCPYGKEDSEKRMHWYNKIAEERGVPNDIYGNMSFEDAANEFEQFLWCNKVGGKVYCFGHCSDFYENTEFVNHKNTSKKREEIKEKEIININNI